MSLSANEKQLGSASHVTDADGRTIVVGPDGAAIGGGSLTLVSESTPGAANPAKTVSVGGSDGTNLRRVATDAAGVLQVDVLVAPLPTATSKGYQQVTSTGLQALTVPSGASKALLQPTGSIRFRDDGSNPTSSVGYPVGTEGFDYDADRIAFLAVYVVSGNLDVFYYA